MTLNNEQKPQPSPHHHSTEFDGPKSYFEPYEITIDSFADFTKALEDLQQVSKVPLMWRGQVRSTWGVHSSLFRLLASSTRFRHLNTLNSDPLPADAYDRRQDYPTEDDLVEAETKILKVAREEWRMESSSALEIFARLQHQGGPTRLLDVSFNPLVAAWFSTLPNQHSDECGRIIAFASKHPESTQEPRIQMDEIWGSYQPTWHAWQNREERSNNDWGTGGLRRYWVPPLFDPRMQAQNAAFILEGLPISSSKTQSSFPNPTGIPNANWRIADIVASGSLYMKMYKIDQPNRTRQWASTFTFLITPGAKIDIQSSLKDIYGFSSSSIYPDLGGLANYLNENKELLSERP